MRSAGSTVRFARRKPWTLQPLLRFMCAQRYLAISKTRSKRSPSAHAQRHAGGEQPGQKPHGSSSSGFKPARHPPPVPRALHRVRNWLSAGPSPPDPIPRAYLPRLLMSSAGTLATDSGTRRGQMKSGKEA
ncbi:hypothetical protein JRQ81_000486 [Phrynocephalus forsythii]|uniref:Uncharacterized protein n=1 Tax=Phrynocephalus forsythii TaxID=171643 RepID=A0A9Q1B822_9SAUR|nr:hypothetical protein JRQ81_000486 [Phrynocephalus forsythii]